VRSKISVAICAEGLREGTICLKVGTRTVRTGLALIEVYLGSPTEWAPRE